MKLASWQYWKVDNIKFNGIIYYTYYLHVLYLLPCLCKYQLWCKYQLGKQVNGALCFRYIQIVEKLFAICLCLFSVDEH